MLLCIVVTPQVLWFHGPGKSRVHRTRSGGILVGRMRQVPWAGGLVLARRRRNIEGRGLWAEDEEHCTMTVVRHGHDSPDFIDRLTCLIFARPESFWCPP